MLYWEWGLYFYQIVNIVKVSNIWWPGALSGSEDFLVNVIWMRQLWRRVPTSLNQYVGILENLASPSWCWGRGVGGWGGVSWVRVWWRGVGESWRAKASLTQRAATGKDHLAEEGWAKEAMRGWDRAWGKGHDERIRKTQKSQYPLQYLMLWGWVPAGAQ